MAYLLDTNVFIQAKNLHYGFDFCPAFWDWLDISNTTQLIFSIDAVRDELIGFGDDLEVWARERDGTFFLKPTSTVLSSLGLVSAWAVAQSYEQAALNTFMGVGESYLVAHALAYEHTVVTHEVVTPSLKKIKIPNVCIGLGVKCITPFKMLQTEHARFVLG